jgi:hypothetical protein
MSYQNLTFNSHFFPKSTNNEIKSFRSKRNRGYFQERTQQNPEGYVYGSAEVKEREYELIREAINGIKAEVPSSLNLDTDNDGYIDNITFILQGGLPGVGFDSDRGSIY